MFNNKKIIAIIPARSGSKGLPFKNVKNLCGKPLITWSIEQAVHSAYIDTVLVSTDCEDIRAISMAAGAEAPFLRPADLATDTASTADVVRHAVAYYDVILNKEFDYVIVLEPTSPLRSLSDIDTAISMLCSADIDYDSLVSLGEVAHHPSIMKRLEKGGVIPFNDELPQTTRRQDNEVVYFPFGVVYLAKTERYLKDGTFYTSRCMGMNIERYQCYEIDDLYDFVCVEAVMSLIREKK